MVHHRWSFKPWELKQRLLGLNQIHSHPEGTQLFSRSALPPDSHRYSNEQLCFSTNSPNSAASSSPPPDSPTILLTNFSSQSCARRSQRSKRSRCTCCTCLPGCPGHHRTGAAPSHATAATSPAGLYKKYVQHAGQGPQLRGDLAITGDSRCHESPKYDFWATCSNAQDRDIYYGVAEIWARRPPRAPTPNGDQHVLYQKANRGCVAEVSLYFLYICKLYRCMVSQKKEYTCCTVLTVWLYSYSIFLTQVCTIQPVYSFY